MEFRAMHRPAIDIYAGDMLAVTHSLLMLRPIALSCARVGGSRIFEHWVLGADAPFVRRLKEANGVMLGKTTRQWCCHHRRRARAPDRTAFFMASPAFSASTSCG